MAPRANWKGFLRLSLVSCPIALYPASSFSEKVIAGQSLLFCGRFSRILSVGHAF